MGIGLKCQHSTSSHFFGLKWMPEEAPCKINLNCTTSAAWELHNFDPWLPCVFRLVVVFRAGRGVLSCGSQPSCSELSWRSAFWVGVVTGFAAKAAIVSSAGYGPLPRFG